MGNLLYVSWKPLQLDAEGLAIMLRGTLDAFLLPEAKMSIRGIRYLLFREKNFPCPSWALQAVCRLFQGRSWTRSCLLWSQECWIGNSYSPESLLEHNLVPRPFSGCCMPSVNFQIHNIQKILPTDLLSRDRSLMFPIFSPHRPTMLWLRFWEGLIMEQWLEATL